MILQTKYYSFFHGPCTSLIPNFVVKICYVSSLDFIGAKDDGGGGNNWSYKTCRAPVKMSPPTNQQARCTSCRQTNSVKALKGKCIALLYIFIFIHLLLILCRFDNDIVFIFIYQSAVLFPHVAHFQLIHSNTCARSAPLKFLSACMTFDHSGRKCGVGYTYDGKYLHQIWSC